MPASIRPDKRAPVALELLGESPGVFSMHLLNETLLITWYGVSTLESTAAYDALCVQARKRFREPLACVHLLTVTVPRMPDAQTRDELTRVNQEHEVLVSACAVVIPVAGFIGSALRGLVTAIVLKTQRTTQNLKIVGSAEAAVEWLAPAHQAATGKQLDAKALLAALQQLSAR